ncbi:MAG: 2-hydroxychromene-2-carboxylate isomerase [Alphaproteobacteria bacterium]|nr:2-hydroxychromene-2-carboxylate isomerase [Alphaproteobacteria bacterium]
MAKSIEFWFDVGSPAAYLAWTQLGGLAKRTGASVVLKPMLLGGVFQAIGNRSPVEVAPKGRYFLIDMGRYAKRYGVPLRLPKGFPINTLPLMRGALVAEKRGELERYLGAVWPAIFDAALPMGDMATVGQVLAKAGLDPAAYAAGIQDPAIKDRLKALTEEAVNKGVFGAPTFFIGEEMFWGQDRLDWVEAAARG